MFFVIILYETVAQERYGTYNAAAYGSIIGKSDDLFGFKACQYETIADISCGSITDDDDWLVATLEI